MTIRKRWTWKNVELEPVLREELGRHFLLDLYRSFLKSDPENVEILLEVGNLYTKTGQTREGLAIDEKLIRIHPDEPIFHYNMACSQSLLGDVDEALLSLRRAIELGYRNFEFLLSDSDLENVRKDGRFEEILEHLRRKVAQEEFFF